MTRTLGEGPKAGFRVSGTHVLRYSPDACVRAGLHCAPLVHEDQGTAQILGAVRIAPGYFTDDEDLEHALGAIEELSR